MPIGPGIHLIDTGFHRPQFDAAYLLIESDRAAFIDCGLNSSVPRLLAALQARDLPVEAVDYLILTHVHLDHAGGTGALMALLPNARLIVHPRGARHMADPSALRAGAAAVYGEAEVERTYGQLQAVDPHRIQTVEDGEAVVLAGRTLRCFDAPGHARHHIVIHDEASQGFFTGDSFGLSYRELDSPRGAFILPTSTPVQFEPEALKQTIRRMLEAEPKVMYLTHFGAVGEIARLAADLLEQIDQMTTLTRDCLTQPNPHAALVQALQTLYRTRAAAHDCALSGAAVAQLLAMDIQLNAQGLLIWAQREAHG